MALHIQPLSRWKPCPRAACDPAPPYVGIEPLGLPGDLGPSHAGVLALALRLQASSEAIWSCWQVTVYRLAVHVKGNASARQWTSFRWRCISELLIGLPRKSRRRAASAGPL
jgi:hypothetical protein